MSYNRHADDIFAVGAQNLAPLCRFEVQCDSNCIRCSPSVSRMNRRDTECPVLRMIVCAGSVIFGYLDHTTLGNSEWVTRPIVRLYYKGRKMQARQLLLWSCGRKKGKVR